MVPRGDIALEHPREETGGHVQSPFAGGNAGDAVKEGHGAEHEGELDEVVALVVPLLLVLGGDGNVSRAEIVPGLVVGDGGAVGVFDVLSEEFLDAGTGSDGTVGELGDALDLGLHLGHDVPEAFGGVGGPGAGEDEGSGGSFGIVGGGEGAEEGDAHGGKGGAEVHGRNLVVMTNTFVC
mmetsp:Transcript_16297/g.27813  ORF Transcript_16297/g.27813 Transcript_16297/m.27813 type:complete len:180 (+) Transcript_16297:1596-2135(+)